MRLTTKIMLRKSLPSCNFLCGRRGTFVIEQRYNVVQTSIPFQRRVVLDVFRYAVTLIFHFSSYTHREQPLKLCDVGIGNPQGTLCGNI